ncbi:MAG: bifunctional nuclease family protein [Thermoproteales archaeon]|nr:bifunctional nuclease family protein [Thermoproteales archaeon]
MENKPKEYSKAEILGVYEVNPPRGAFVVLLEGEDWNGYVLPIMIGMPEASAIQAALEGYIAERPMTHDLIMSMLGALGVTIEKVTIDALINNVFTATIVLNESGKSIYVDARPSDSIALALRANAPIFVARRLIKNAIPKDAVELD